MFAGLMDYVCRPLQLTMYSISDKDDLLIITCFACDIAAIIVVSILLSGKADLDINDKKIINMYVIDFIFIIFVTLTFDFSY